jgi:hypothetical protein
VTRLTDDIGDIRQRAQVEGSVTRILSHGEEALDQDARDTARDALSKISSHETLCTERWLQSRAALDNVSHEVRNLKKSLDRHIAPLPASIIAVLMGLCGWLSARAFPLH